jgi:arginine/glutamate-rich protein 1
VQAEDQLKLVQEQRQMLEARQNMEAEMRRKKRQEQEVILNKSNARPRLSFSLGGKS